MYVGEFLCRIEGKLRNSRLGRPCVVAGFLAGEDVYQ